MKRLVLHIGIEKTGTTSIQHFLYANEAFLHSQGHGLLQTFGRPNNRQIAHFAEPGSTGLPAAREHPGAEAGSDWRERMRADLRSEIGAMDAGLHTLIVSSEHLHSRLPDRQDVARVAWLFEGLFDVVDVFVYLRRPDEHAVSLLSTALRAGWTEAHPLRKPEGRAVKLYDYHRRLDHLAQCFGEQHVHVRVFERSRFVAGDLLTDFMDFIGASHLMPDMALPPPKNEALSAVAATGLLHFNRAVEDLGFEQESKARKALRLGFAESLNQQFPGPGLLPTRDEARRFHDRFAASNALVSQRWFSGLALFQEDFSRYPEAPQNVVFPEAAVGALMVALRAYLEAGTSADGLAAALDEVEDDAPGPRLLRQLAAALRATHAPLAKRLRALSRADSAG